MVVALALALALALEDPRPYTGVTAVPADPSSRSVTVAAPLHGTGAPRREDGGSSRDPPASRPSTRPSAAAPSARSPEEPEAIFPRPHRRERVAPEERAVLPTPRGQWLRPVGPPGALRGAVETPTEAPPATAEATDGQVVQWQQRRRSLRAAVAAFGTLAGVGAVLTIAPFVVGGDDEDATGLVPIFASGAALLALGGAGTALIAPWLGHHARWDRPTDLARTTPPRAAYRARRHTRRLLIALGVEGGLVLVGGLSVGMGFVGALACADPQDLDCTGPRVVAGGAVGYTLIGVGGLAMVSTGILIGLQKRHGHTDGSGPRLASLSPGGVTIRF